MGAPRGTVGELRAYRPSGALVAGAAALVLAAAGGWWLGGTSREPVAAPAPDTVVAVGGLTLELESTWVGADSVPGLPSRAPRRSPPRPAWSSARCS